MTQLWSATTPYALENLCGRYGFWKKLITALSDWTDLQATKLGVPSHGPGLSSPLLHLEKHLEALSWKTLREALLSPPQG